MLRLLVAYRGGRYGTDWGAECISFNNNTIDFIENSEVKNVILSSPFGQLKPATALTLENGEVPDQNNGLGRAQFNATLERLNAAGKQVLIVSPMPRPKHSVADCVIKASFAGVAFDRCDFLRSDDIRDDINELLAEISDENNVPLLLLKDFLCNGRTCPASIGGVPLYRDGSHISEQGSALFGERFDFASLILGKLGLSVSADNGSR